jgi:hypothetical protein
MSSFVFPSSFAELLRMVPPCATDVTENTHVGQINTICRLLISGGIDILTIDVAKREARCVVEFETGPVGHESSFAFYFYANSEPYFKDIPILSVERRKSHGSEGEWSNWTIGQWNPDSFTKKRV